MLRTLKKALLIFSVLGVLMSCDDQGNKPEQSSSDPSTRNIVAYPGELPFDKQYNIVIKLPMKEVDFIRKLDVLSLKYSIVGDPKKGLANPSPRISDRLSDNDIALVYQIYGGLDKNKSVGRTYRAFVNKNDNVIYIENAFEYPGT